MNVSQMIRMMAGALVLSVMAGSSPLLAEEPAPSASVPQATAPATPQEAASTTIHDDVSVEMQYTLTADNKVVDSTEGREPFKYVHGKGQIIPGLEKQLVGMHVGDTKDITVSSEEGYGPVDPSAFVEVPKTQLPKEVKPEVGLILRGVDPDGHQFRATIHEIKDQTVTLDLNHPLAGKTLMFKVKILNISPAS